MKGPLRTYIDEDPELDQSSEDISQFKLAVKHFSYVPEQGQALTKRRPTITNLPSPHPVSDTDEPPPSTPRPSPRKRNLEADQRSPKKRSTSSPAIPVPLTPRQKRGYAPPDMYAHLNGLMDYLQPGLDVVFCGINPGYKSAQIGHHFAHHSNHFYRVLHESGFTDIRIPPEEDTTLPARFNIGMTNLVDRPTSDASQLSAAEKAASVPTFLAKIARFRPLAVGFVGLDIAKVVETQIGKICDISDAIHGASLTKNTTEAASHELDAAGEVNEDATASCSLKPSATTSPSKRRGKSRPKPRSKSSTVPAFGPGLMSFKLVYPDTETNEASRGGNQSTARENPKETFFYAMPSSSGLVTQYQLPHKIEIAARLKAMTSEAKAGLLSTTKCHPIIVTSTSHDGGNLEVTISRAES